MNIVQLLLLGVEKLKTIPHIDSPKLDCEVLLSHILQKDRVYLVTHRDESVSEENEQKYMEFINRRMNHTPISYITGNKEFMSLCFSVAEGVLIPRPDTETLVETVIEQYQNQSPALLDLCAGSGAIAVSLAKYLPKAEVYAMDFSDICVKCATKNAFNNGVADRVKVIQQDILKDFETNILYDCIVSNPPYIKTEVIETLEDTVKKFEPHSALDGGEDGLAFYRRIIKIAPQMLKTNGILAFEVGYDQADDVYELLTKSNAFHQIQIRCDLAGIRRVLYAAIR